MAVTTAGAVRSERAEYARDARLARAWALIVDSVVLAVITFIVNSVYGVTQNASGLPAITVGGQMSTVVPWPWLLLVGIVYFMVPEAMFGATPGKYWARIRVVRVDRQRLNLGAVVIRNVLKPIDWLPIFYLVGGASVLITANSQRLGDLAAGTTVVYRHRALEPGATRSSRLATRRIALAILVLAILFTLGFDYFGRPPMVIEGLTNTGVLGPGNLNHSSPVLGAPRWSWGQVTYPVVGSTDDPKAACAGTLTLDWGWLAGWQLGSLSYSCNLVAAG